MIGNCVSVLIKQLIEKGDDFFPGINCGHGMPTFLNDNQLARRSFFLKSLVKNYRLMVGNEGISRAVEMNEDRIIFGDMMQGRGLFCLFSVLLNWAANQLTFGRVGGVVNDFARMIVHLQKGTGSVIINDRVDSA